MNSVFEEHISRQAEQIRKTPYMIIDKTEKWVVVEDSPKNIEKFNNIMKEYNISLDEFKVYKNDFETFMKILEGIDLRNLLEEERKKQAELENPIVELDINNKDELINYMLEEIYDLRKSLIYEFSTDTELDEVKLDARHTKLLELVEKYLKQ